MSPPRLERPLVLPSHRDLSLCLRCGQPHGEDSYTHRRMLVLCRSCCQRSLDQMGAPRCRWQELREALQPAKDVN